VRRPLAGLLTSLACHVAPSSSPRSAILCTARHVRSQGARRLSTGTTDCFVSENVILIRFLKARQRAHRDVRESEHTHDACCERLPGSQGLANLIRSTSSEHSQFRCACGKSAGVRARGQNRMPVKPLSGEEPGCRRARGKKTHPENRVSHGVRNKKPDKKPSSCARYSQ